MAIIPRGFGDLTVVGPLKLTSAALLGNGSHKARITSDGRKNPPAPASGAPSPL